MVQADTGREAWRGVSIRPQAGFGTALSPPNGTGYLAFRSAALFWAQHLHNPEQALIINPFPFDTQTKKESQFLSQISRK